MKRFRFRFETVLRQRQIIEEQRMQEFARAQGELAACEGRIAACRADFDMTVSNRPAVFDAQEIPRRERYLDTLSARIEQEGRVREGLAARVEDTRKALIAARQAREALERIRESDFQAYRREAGQAEQKALDEISTQRFQRLRGSHAEA